MGQLIRLLRLKLSPEDGGFLRRLAWPPDAMFTGMSFHLADGTNIRLSADVAREMQRCLVTAAGNAEDGRAVQPVEVGDDDIARMEKMLDAVNGE